MSYLSKTLTVVATLLMFTGAATAKQSPETVEGATTVTVEEAVTLFDDGVVFVDVRKPSDYEAGRITGAVHLDVKTDLTEESLAAVVAKSEPVLFYCNGHSCLRSAKATTMAVGWGYTNVFYLRDGYPAWEVSGNMVE
ncbi:rhodanese-like domain-containing protein [Pseudophaeobacter sp.]|uniref:rhodanese-like domain-containing protein n=1 Tax=Pseudophaeobacter sp. TaxID=1971739 RepID=UPI003297CED4